MAIVHIAIFDAVIAITGGYRSYTGISPAPKDTSMNAAIAQAAHDTLSALFPSQAPNFDMALEEDLKLVPNGRAKNEGIDLGRSGCGRDTGAARKTTARSTLSRVSVSITLLATSRASGDRTPSV